MLLAARIIRLSHRCYMFGFSLTKVKEGCGGKVPVFSGNSAALSSCVGEACEDL